MSGSSIIRVSRRRMGINWSLAHLIFDGDSLMASHASSVTMRVPARVAAFPPASGNATSTVLAIGGQTTQDMIDNATDVDAAYQAGRTNILITFAGTNGMIDGAVAQADRMRTYIAARKAARPGLIVVLGGLIPRYEASAISIAERNDRMTAYNALCRDNWRTWGASAYFDTQPEGGPFDLPDWSLSSFTREQTLPLWSTADPADIYTHLSDAGAAYVAQQICSALRRL